MPLPTTYRIGTRGSRLALIQAASVRDRLARAYPADTFELVPIVTKGDRVIDRPLASIGGSGVFVREIERALLAGEIDLAVHSMKDLPAEQPKGLCFAKAWPREDPRDALVGATLGGLPLGATVATGSARRAHFLHARRPDLHLVDIRGNVDTRLRKLFDPQPGEPRLDALVLAAAGLKRLGRAEVIAEYLDPLWMIPAPNQGQLAIELRVVRDPALGVASNRQLTLKAMVDALGDDRAEAAAQAERAFLRSTGANCHEAVAAYAHFENGVLKLESFYEASGISVGRL